MADKNWIAEQKEIHGRFRGGGNKNDADRLFELSPTNRYIGAKQGKILIYLRLLSHTLACPCLAELAGDIETAQLCIEKDSRKDFMRVAIEQWQGKLAAAKKKTLDTLGAAL